MLITLYYFSTYSTIFYHNIIHIIAVKRFICIIHIMHSIVLHWIPVLVFLAVVPDDEFCDPLALDDPPGARIPPTPPVAPSHSPSPARIYCNPFPAKPFYGSHRLDPVMIRPPGIDNGAFVVSPETVWYARVLLLFSASAKANTGSNLKSFDCALVTTMETYDDPENGYYWC